MGIFHIVTQGNLGNRMIQHLVARRLEALIPNLMISNSRLPQWGIDYPEIENKGRIWEFRTEQHLSPKTFSRLFRDGDIDCIRYSGYGQRMENLGDHRDCSKLFHSSLTNAIGYDERHLVINIRGGEVLDGRHPGYVLVPIDFYKTILNQTQLSPVFMGQIEDNIFCNALRSAFPNATFIPSQGELHDFELLRGSVNIVPSVSTFSWLACWLSSTARTIILPLTGIFNPFQYRDHDFVPLGDTRYRFFWFPANYASRVEDYELDHRALVGRHEEIKAIDLARIRQSHVIEKKDLDDFVSLFDEQFYLSRHADVMIALRNGLPNGLLHYVNAGFSEGRDAFPLDKHHYVREYPQAARELGLGLYEDARHHFAAVGNRRGYNPTGETLQRF